MATLASVGSGVIATDSPTESIRFDRRVRRYEWTGDDPQPLVDAIAADDPDLAIVRIPTHRGEVLHRLQAVADEVILGDCLVVYGRDNLRMGPPAAPANPAFQGRMATAADLDPLDALVATSFAGYRNHYAANPRLGASFDIVSGYREWTRNHIGTGERRCYLAEVGGVPRGFMTVRVSPGESEIVLNGVDPAFQGQGVYRDLLRAVLAQLVAEGSPRTVVSTQLDNRPVQRVWVREGFYLGDSQYTLHLNRHVQR